MRVGTRLALGICLLAAGLPAAAQDYPNRTITIVSNYPPPAALISSAGLSARSCRNVSASRSWSRTSPAPPA